MTDVLLLPDRATYNPGHTVRIEVRDLDSPGEICVRHWGDPIVTMPVSADGTYSVGQFTTGGYSVHLDGAHTAFDVVSDRRAVLRYGFVVDYRPDRDLAGVHDNIRRLHLTGIQFYDWAYRHADLLGGGDTYTDALDQPVSLQTVRNLVDMCHRAGAAALGYAAVYAVGNDEWPRWAHDALLDADDQPYRLGDFLSLVDPAAGDWLRHFTADLSQSTEQIGFDGFHLDQYGYPKHAHTPDGCHIDTAERFTAAIGSIRETLPTARLVFNNVNDFPTWATAAAPQNAVYVEVWEPQVGLEHLAQTVMRARAVAGGKPVVIAAYQHVYDEAPAVDSDLAATFTMATLFSHGATHLLAGEADRVLVDPYYVRNHVTTESTADLLHRYYDFAVAHTELLFDPGIVEVTSSFASDYNSDIDVTYDSATVEQIARAGTVWRRITRLPDGRYVMHLINLTGQTDTAWDAARMPPGSPGPATIRVRRVGPEPPRVRVASPDTDGVLRDVPMTAGGEQCVGKLPEPFVWQTVLIDPWRIE